MRKTFSDIESVAPALVCPACGTSSIRVYLRCDGGDRECLTVASCDNCGTQFSAEVLPTYLERYEAVRRDASQQPCVVCHGRHRTVRSLCDRARKRCSFLVSCDTCGDVRVA